MSESGTVSWGVVVVGVSLFSLSLFSRRLLAQPSVRDGQEATRLHHSTMATHVIAAFSAVCAPRPCVSYIHFSPSLPKPRAPAGISTYHGRHFHQ
jgi:hypothetical protein